jgi:hypothetical protein
MHKLTDPTHMVQTQNTGGCGRGNELSCPFINFYLIHSTLQFFIGRSSSAVFIPLAPSSWNRVARLLTLLGSFQHIRKNGV